MQGFFTGWLVIQMRQEHDPQIDGLVPGEDISSVRPDVTWPWDGRGNRLFDQGADDDLEMELVNTIAQHNGGPLEGTS